MKSIGDRWPFLRTPSKKKQALDRQRVQEQQRALQVVKAAVLEARHDAQMAELIERRQVRGRLAMERERFAIERDEPLYIINEEQDLTDV